MKELFKLSNKLKVSVAGIVIEGLLSGCNFLVLFQVLKLIFSTTVTFHKIQLATAALVVIFVLRFVLYLTAYTGSQIGGSDISRHLRIAIGDKLNRIPLNSFTKKRTGFYINAATSEIADYEQIITHKFADIVKYSILLTMVGLYCCTIYLPAGLIILAATLLVIPAYKEGKKKVYIHGVSKNLAREKNVSSITEYLTGSQTLRSYGLVGTKNISLTKSMKDYSDISYNYEKSMLPSGFIFNFFSYIALGLAIILGSNAWLDGTLSSAETIILIMLPLFTAKVNMTLYISLISYRNLNLSKEKITSIFAESEDNKHNDSFHPNHFNICFNKIDFQYIDKEPVLNNVNFEVPEGSLTAIVGDSGSGKSTILNLLSKYYCAQKGKITIGNSDISNVPAEQVLEYISLVDQNVFLFNDSILENIRYAKPTATDQDIHNACKLANCEDFIVSTENGYNTEIGENGCKLSGGERQRLSIARAILKDSPIILLDEATASLDIENELLVKEAITKLLKKGKTVIMIAHTLPIIKHADQILVLDGGCISECGTHDQLINKGGKYSAMWQASKALR